MIKLRDRFDRREEFGGLSNMKTWGIAALGGYIAACITLHPGDMPEYVIPSQERSTIVFSTHGLSDPSSKRDFFPWEVRARSENVAVIQSAILDTVLEYEQREDFTPSTLSNKITYAAIMASTLVWDSARPERLQLARSAAIRLAKSGEVDLSPEIECLDLLLSSAQSPSSAKAQIQQATERRDEKELASSPALLRLVDTCTFCGKFITWENLLEATCVAGHPYSKLSSLIIITSFIIEPNKIKSPKKFLTTKKKKKKTTARCSLTFLPILHPGISKSCTICTCPFLNEHLRIPSSATPVVEVEDGDEDKAGLSLADMLFRIYDTCPYCGGKFVG